VVALSKMIADLPIGTAQNLPVNVTANSHVEEDTETDIEETSSKRICKPTQKVTDLLEGRAMWSGNINKTVLAPGIQQPTEDWTANAAEFEDEQVLAAEISNAEVLEPRNLAEAKSHLDWLLWEIAIEEELKTLKEVGTWELVDAPKGVNVVGSKGCLRLKRMLLGMLYGIKLASWPMAICKSLESITSTCLHL